MTSRWKSTWKWLGLCLRFHRHETRWCSDPFLPQASRHRADINIHGHYHDLHREDFSRLYLPLSLEAMGYQPIALDAEFLGTMASWVSRRRIPKLKEIYELKQNHRPLSLRDIYGQQGKERFIRKFDGTPEPDIHAILKKFCTIPSAFT